jgi:hypothetical protein
MAEKRDPLIDGITRPGGGDHFYSPYDKRILGWIKEAVEEGDRVNRADPVYDQMDSNQAFVCGDQIPANRPSYLPAVVLNRTKKAIRTHTAAITDIRPLFGYKTQNTRFESQAHLLNQLTVVWWLNAFVDLRIAEVVKYALTQGSGDVVVEYDPHYLNGDTRLLVRDPRDTLAIRPQQADTLQDWRGVILREAYSPGALQSFYPDFPKEVFQPDTSSMWGQVFTRLRRALRVITPTSTLDGLNKARTPSDVSPKVGLYRCFLHDAQINLNTKPVLMGPPDSNTSYLVEPGKPLYPRGRLIVATEKAITYDGPNPFWHGMFPVLRLKLDPWPWSFFGLPLIADTQPIQNAINGTLSNILMAFSQSVNRGLIADKNAVPEPVFRRFDSRKPNWKLKTNPTMGEGVRLQEGPQLPPWTFELLNALIQQHDDLTEIPNLQQVAQLRQMPSGDTIEKYYSALTPGLQMEGRLLEVFLRELAEMVKCNIFQFYTMRRRILVLGEAGKDLADFDFDPANLVPAMDKADEGYVPELDRSFPTPQRAQFFHKLFAFYVKPKSMLALHSQEEQLKYLQLSRQGYVDFWTLLEMMEVPNVGRPPAVPLPVKDYQPPPSQPDPATGAMMPPAPPPMEVREPFTITERLIAQQQLGLGQTVSPVGRKSSGQAPPEIKQRPDGSTTVSESG